MHGTYGRALATWCSGVAHVSVLMHWNNAGCLRRGVYFDQEDTSYLPAWLILPKIFGKHCIEMGGPRDLKHRPERPQTRCQMTAACMTSIKHSVAAVGLPPSAHTKQASTATWGAGQSENTGRGRKMENALPVLHSMDKQSSGRLNWLKPPHEIEITRRNSPGNNNQAA